MLVSTDPKEIRVLLVNWGRKALKVSLGHLTVPYEALFCFYLGQKGVVGSVGQKGQKGNRGPIGPKGEQSIIADIGPIGEKGILGPVGPQGTAGIQGVSFL